VIAGFVIVLAIGVIIGALLGGGLRRWVKRRFPDVDPIGIRIDTIRDPGDPTRLRPGI
jgi:hypothetical protein